MTGTHSLLDIILESNDSQTVKTKAIIEVTSHTVKLENDIYRFRNVTGFGVSNVKVKGIPLSFIFTLLVLALLAASIPGVMSIPTFSIVTIVVWLLLIGGVI